MKTKGLLNLKSDTVSDKHKNSMRVTIGSIKAKLDLIVGIKHLTIDQIDREWYQKIRDMITT